MSAASRTLAALSIAVLVITSLIGPVSARQESATDAETIKQIRTQSRETIEVVRDTLREARGMDREARNRLIENLLSNVIAPLVSTSDSLREFYTPHFEEIEQLGLVEASREAALALLRDNYLFVLERSLDSRIRMLGVSVDGDRATARFLVYAMTTIPIDLELYRLDDGMWRVYDAQFLGKSVRDGIHEQMHSRIEEQGLEEAIRSLAFRNDSGKTE